MGKRILQGIFAAWMIVGASAQTTNTSLPAVDTNAATLPPITEPIAAPATSPVAETNAPVKTVKPKPKKPANVFAGTLTAVDKTNLTFTVESKTGKSATYIVTSKTRLTKGGKPATFSEATVGEMVRGAYAKGKDAKLKVLSAEYGAPAPKAAAHSHKKKALKADHGHGTAPADGTNAPAHTLNPIQ